jgi:hypothetical protein
MQAGSYVQVVDHLDLEGLALHHLDERSGDRGLARLQAVAHLAVR